MTYTTIRQGSQAHIIAAQSDVFLCGLAFNILMPSETLKTPHLADCTACRNEYLNQINGLSEDKQND